MKAKRGSSKKRALVRGEPVVRGVLEATLEELADVGYGALRIEEVAARAGVNKTTIYRRWPTKQELVQAALQSITVDRIITPDTGSLRGDLLEIGRHMVALASTPEGQSMRRMLIAEERNSELLAIGQSILASMQAAPRPVIEAAQARGELSQGVDPLMIFSVLASAVHHRLLLERKQVDDAYLTQLVDLLLLGALAPDKPKKDAPKRSPKPDRDAP
ncbi:TetR/AcrR family transcriptional regulator [Polyangium aurulentum]|uniref:TetR/AcrR family transcriptional regulator n=1 Tax=Polyangium aurulentum TaxID=2567896 RepID=UPI0010AE2EB6|nr:TetR/AcrR family transcriptional regulator [Polyangium aurulentum]UQA54641.1 TetR/AcrR family transcriptional regulator [Polyangium aurulentum]